MRTVMRVIGAGFVSVMFFGLVKITRPVGEGLSFASAGRYAVVLGMVLVCLGVITTQPRD